MKSRAEAGGDGQARLRAAALQARYAHIARTRMAGLPLLNPALQVEAIGFEALAATAERDAPVELLGVLVTPWFMNLVLLPLLADGRSDGVGRTRRATIAGQCFEFIGAHEPGLGAYAACSLFSPMDEFRDAATARLTATAVLDLLRQVSPAPADPVSANAAGPSTAAAVQADAQAPGQAQPPRDAARRAQDPPADVSAGPARRGFLFGRSAAGGARA